MLDTVARKIYGSEKETESVLQLQNQSDQLRRQLIEAGLYEQLMFEAGCATSLDFRRYAQKLLLPEFKD
jgi:hypothetical protein